MIKTHIAGAMIFASLGILSIAAAKKENAEQSLIVEIEGPAGEAELRSACESLGCKSVTPIFASLGKTRPEIENRSNYTHEKFPERSARAGGTKKGNAPELLRFFRVTFNDQKRAHEAVPELSARPGIGRIDDDAVLRDDFTFPSKTISPRPSPSPSPSPSPACLSPNDPLYCDGRQDAIERIRVPEAWTVVRYAPKQIVAVIDDGVDWEHEDLSTNLYSNLDERLGAPGVDDDGNGFVDDLHGWNFSLGTPNTDAPHTASHGTKVAGIIAATGNNGRGIAGVVWRTKILPVVASSESHTAEAIVYATNEGADVINISKGNGISPVIRAAMDYARSHGVAVFTSAGNNANKEAHDYQPYPKAFVVGGTHDTDVGFQTGPMLDFAAEGFGVTTTYAIDSSSSAVGNYGPESGTSFSTPMAAGVATLVLARDSTRTLEELRQILRRTSTDIGNTGWDMQSGFGRIDAYRAVTYTGSVCEAVIQSPNHYHIVRGGPIKVSGTASGRHFGSYRVTLGRGMPYWKRVRTPTGGYQTIKDIVATSSASATKRSDDVLASIPVASTLEGSFTLHLEVLDSAGKVCGEDFKVFHISPRSIAAWSLQDPQASRLGTALASGDVNGDGVGDLLVSDTHCYKFGCESNSASALYYNARAGIVRLIPGRKSGLSQQMDVNIANLATASWVGQANGGTDRAELFGHAVTTANLDGDKYADVVITSPGNARSGEAPAGRVCVYLGKNHAHWTAGMTYRQADYCFVGEASDDRLGSSLANIGDFDGDGQDELAVGACGNDQAGTDFGKAYVLYSSQRSTWPSPIQDSDHLVNRAAGTQLTGTSTRTPLCGTRGGQGMPISPAVDLNGDGLTDLVIGDPLANVYDPTWGNSFGEVRVFFGSRTRLASGSMTSARLVITNTLQNPGFIGANVVPAGDLNGDGIDELLIGYGKWNAFQDWSAGMEIGLEYANYGGFYVIPGKTAYTSTGAPSSLSVTSAAAGAVNDPYTMQMGYFAAVGRVDVNRDGYGDVVFASPAYGGYNAGGMLWVAYGSPSGIRSGSNRDIANTVLKVDEYDGIANQKSFFGYSLAVVDLNGNGKPELVVGQPDFAGGYSFNRVYPGFSEVFGIEF